MGPYLIRDVFALSLDQCGPLLLLKLRLGAQQQKWTTFSPLSGQNSYIWGARGGPRNLIFIGILLFLLLRNPCKNLKSYDNPFWGKSKEGKNNNKNRKVKKFRSRRWGSSLPGLRTRDPPLSPPST